MITLIGGEKGGTGKSTIAVNLASYRISQANHNNLLLVDTDPQGSASDWVQYRKEEGIKGIDSFQLFDKKIKTEVLDQAERYDDIIIDAGGRDSSELRYSMLVADQMIVPVNPTQFDINTAPKIAELLNQARIQNEELICFVLLNRCRTIPNYKKTQEALAILAEYEEFIALEFVIHERMAFADSAEQGRGVHEIPFPDEKAVTEIKQLHDVVYSVRAEQNVRAI